MTFPHAASNVKLAIFSLRSTEYIGNFFDDCVAATAVGTSFIIETIRIMEKQTTRAPARSDFLFRIITFI
jgi:hypothetical protein